MRKRGVYLSVAFFAICALWSARNAARTSSVLGGGQLVQRLLDRADATSTSQRRPLVILLLTTPHYPGSPLWYFQTTEMGNPFVGMKCQYSNCVVTSNKSHANEAALVVFRGPIDSDCCTGSSSGVSCVLSQSDRFDLPATSSANAFVYYQMEAPSRSRRQCLVPLDDVVNYTWSYKSDSDVLKQYGTYYRLPELARTSEVRDFDSSASRSVLWYVSNCNHTPEARQRWQYAVELRKHIDVDIFGRCSNKTDGCPSGDARCVSEFRRRYKFYLAFENSHCDEYVTEKFYMALRHGNVPIVMGLSRAQYEQLAPPRSFIHADDFASPQELAGYLRRLAASPDEYSGYHAWRERYGVRMFADDECKLCELATLRPPKRVRVSDWWSAERNCPGGA